MESKLKNIYGFIKEIGLINNLPNLNEVKNDMYYFSAIHNTVYSILSKKTNIDVKTNELKQLGIFTNDQIKWIINNNKIIKQPFEIVNKNRKFNKGKNETFIIQDAGNQYPYYNLDEIDREILEKLEKFGFSTDMFNNEHFFSDFKKLFNFSKLYDIDINSILKKYNIPKDSNGFRRKILEMDDLGIAQAIFRKDPALLIEILKRADPNIIKKKLANIYSDIGNNLEFIDGFLLMMGFKPEDIEAIKLILPTPNNILNPEITLVDWIFFPLWSVENLNVIGPLAGPPIDFLSILVAQADFLTEHMVDTLGEVRDPAVQAALSFFAASTAGAGLAVTPFIAPVVNKTFDLVIHILGNMGKILNFFVNMSRKNFGLAFTLFSEIIPVIEEINEITHNYMVILNRALKRNQKLTKQYIGFIDNYSDIILMISNPWQINKYKNQLMEKLRARVASKKNEANNKINNIKNKKIESIHSKIPSVHYEQNKRSDIPTSKK